MELNAKEKNMIIIAMMIRIEYIIESNSLDGSGYWENELEEANNLYRRFMGCDYDIYTNHKIKQNQQYIIQ